jgi:hypothetical protein
MKKCLIIQPGAFGDIILCAPIAKIYHDNGYKVFWPTTKKFQPLINSFPYVNHILLDDHSHHPDWLRSDVIKILNHPIYNDSPLILNLADRGPHPTAERNGENFEQCKYRLSNVPIEYKHDLKWTRNTEKENKLYKDVVGTKRGYTFCCLESSRGDKTELPMSKENIIEGKIIENYNIFDWYKIIINAKEIYCVESAFHQFMDGIISHIDNIPKYILSRSTLKGGESYTYSPYWNKKYIK